jgi:hypothetical protein
MPIVACSIIWLFSHHQQLANKSQALDEALHHFLDQRPAGKNLSWLDRATGLAAAPFWREADVVNASKLSALAMSRILRHEGAISIELLEHLVSRSSGHPQMGNPLFQTFYSQRLRALETSSRSGPRGRMAHLHRRL